MSDSLRLIRIHPADHVAVAVETIDPGTDLRIGELTVTAREQIPSGHKVAMLPIRRGENVIKYGHPIGQATTDIEPGAHVHLHNLQTSLGDILDYEYMPQLAEVQAADTSFPPTGDMPPMRRANRPRESRSPPPVKGCSRPA